LTTQQNETIFLILKQLILFLHALLEIAPLYQSRYTGGNALIVSQ